MAMVRKRAGGGHTTTLKGEGTCYPDLGQLRTKIGFTHCLSEIANCSLADAGETRV